MLRSNYYLDVLNIAMNIFHRFESIVGDTTDQKIIKNIRELISHFSEPFSIGSDGQSSSV